MRGTDVPPEVLSFALGYLVLVGLGLVWAGQKVFLWVKKLATEAREKTKKGERS